MNVSHRQPAEMVKYVLIVKDHSNVIQGVAYWKHSATSLA